jgi:hypothetical protein
MAYEMAATGSYVLYVAIKNKIEAKIPLKVSEIGENRRPVGVNSATSYGVMSRISMKYVSNASEFKLLCASLHSFAPSPTCIVVDDLTSIIDPLGSVSRHDRTFLEMVTLCSAYLDDAVNFLTKRNHTPADLQGSRKRPRNGNSEAKLPTRSSVRVVVTADCFDEAFIHAMFRYTNCALLLHRTTENATYDFGGRNTSSSSNRSSSGAGSRLAPNFQPLSATNHDLSSSPRNEVSGGDDDETDTTIIRLSEGSLRSTCTEVVRMAIRWKDPAAATTAVAASRERGATAASVAYDHSVLKNGQLFIFSSSYRAQARELP